MAFLSICDRFAPGMSDLVLETFTLAPPDIERHFGITKGHIHHIDNSFGFADRVPYRFGLAGLYSCSAGTAPGRSRSSARLGTTPRRPRSPTSMTEVAPRGHGNTRRGGRRCGREPPSPDSSHRARRRSARRR